MDGIEPQTPRRKAMAVNHLLNIYLKANTTIDFCSMG